MSAIDENVDYYTRNPQKYSPGKIDKETWLSQQDRTKIKALIEDRLAPEKKKKHREFERDVRELARAKKRRRRLETDKRGQVHNRDLRTGRFVKVPQKVKKSTPTRNKNRANKV